MERNAAKRGGTESREHLALSREFALPPGVAFKDFVAQVERRRGGHWVQVLVGVHDESTEPAIGAVQGWDLDAFVGQLRRPGWNACGAWTPELAGRRDLVEGEETCAFVQVLRQHGQDASVRLGQAMVHGSSQQMAYEGPPQLRLGVAEWIKLEARTNHAAVRQRGTNDEGMLRPVVSWLGFQPFIDGAGSLPLRFRAFGHEVQVHTRDRCRGKRHASNRWLHIDVHGFRRHPKQSLRTLPRIDGAANERLGCIQVLLVLHEARLGAQCHARREQVPEGDELRGIELEIARQVQAGTGCGLQMKAPTVPLGGCLRQTSEECIRFQFRAPARKIEDRLRVAYFQAHRRKQRHRGQQGRNPRSSGRVGRGARFIERGQTPLNQKKAGTRIAILISRSQENPYACYKDTSRHCNSCSQLPKYATKMDYNRDRMASTRLLILVSALFVLGSLFAPAASAWTMNSTGMPTIQCSFREGSAACVVCGPEEGDYLLQPHTREKKGASIAFTEVYYADQCDGTGT